MSASDAHVAAVTIKVAAGLLGVKREYVHYLLAHDKLHGPAYDGPAPRGAPRVYRWSIARYLHNREESRRRREAGRRRRESTTTGSDAELLRRLDELTRIIKEDLRKQRARSNEIANQLVDLVVLEAKIARKQAQAVDSHVSALTNVERAFSEFTAHAGHDESIVDQVLAGYRDILTCLLNERAQRTDA